MKKYLFPLAALALGLSASLFTACSDDNDNEGGSTPDIIDDESVVQTDEEAFALVAGAFGAYQDLSSTFTELSEGATDYGSTYLGSEDDSGIRIVSLDLDETNDYPTWAWEDLYWSIGTANDAIDKIGASTKVSAAARSEAIARAKFVRALDYSLLVVYFGEVPLRLTVDDESTDRASIDAVYAQIVKDLTEAEADLPETTSTPVNPSKGAARALLARVYLQWAGNPLTAEQLTAIAASKTDPQVTYNAERLQLAIDAADRVINSGHYSLLPVYGNNWGRANESRGPEHIFTIQQDGDGIDVMGNHQYHCAWTFPFQEENGQVSHIHPIHTFDAWPDDDPRKAFSVLTELTDPKTGVVHHFLPPVTLPVYGKGVDRSYENSLYETIERNDVDQVQIRYAEVLLIKAEALYHLNNGRHNDEAIALVNQLRERAYGDTDHDLHHLTLADIQNEWTYEFVYEQKHWQNLVRWGALISTVQGVSRFQHFDDSYAVAGGTGADGSTVNALFARTHKILHAKYDNVSGRNYRFPIPLREDGSGLEVEQNPGY